NDQGRPNFQLLQRRMHLSDRRDIARMSLAVPVCYFVFDLLAFDQFDLRGRDFFEAVGNAGLEGIMAKLRASPYRGRRSGDWLKIKCPLTLNFVIGGYTDPAGSRTYFGALLLGQYESDGRLRFTEKVGTGFNHDTLRNIHELMSQRTRDTSPFRRPAAGEPPLPAGAHFCEPELVCKVR